MIRTSIKFENKSPPEYFKIKKDLKCWIPKLITNQNSFLSFQKINSKINLKISGIGFLCKNHFSTSNGHKNFNGLNQNSSMSPLNKENILKSKLNKNKQK
jgi:hypothetical protein